MHTRFLLPLLFAAPAWAAAPAPNGDLSDATCPYPPAALQAQAQGASLLSVTGTRTGDLIGVRIVQSSGNPDLDRAAIACVADWHFDPDSKLGALYVGTRRVQIGWSIGDDDRTAVGRRIAIAHSCVNDYPAAAMAARAEGVTVVRFTVTEEGRVIDPAVDRSSGNAILDKAALACVAHWHYRPAIKDGEPVAVPWQAEVRWALPSAAPPAASDTQ